MSASIIVLVLIFVCLFVATVVLSRFVVLSSYALIIHILIGALTGFTGVLLTIIFVILCYKKPRNDTENFFYKIDVKEKSIPTPNICGHSSISSIHVKWDEIIKSKEEVKNSDIVASASTANPSGKALKPSTESKVSFVSDCTESNYYTEIDLNKPPASDTNTKQTVIRTPMTETFEQKAKQKEKHCFVNESFEEDFTYDYVYGINPHKSGN